MTDLPTNDFSAPQRNVMADYRRRVPEPLSRRRRPMLPLRTLIARVSMRWSIRLAYLAEWIWPEVLGER